MKVEQGKLDIEKQKLSKQSVDEGGRWYVSTKELADYKNRTAKLDREASALEGQKASLTTTGTPDQFSQDALKRIDERLHSIDAEKEKVKQNIIDNRPKSRSQNSACNPTQPNTNGKPQKTITARKFVRSRIRTIFPMKRLKGNFVMPNI